MRAPLRACLLPLLLAAGCGSAPPRTPPTQLITGGLAAWVDRGPQDKPVLVVGTVTPDGTHKALAHSNGLYLSLKEDNDFRVSLPFESVTSDGRLLRLQCHKHGNHTPGLSVRAADGGGLLVEVDDVVGLQSRVREVTIDYFLDADSPVEESWVPHLHPGPDYVAGDESWQLPLAFLRAGEHALALVPEPAGRELRRLPQALRVDPELRRIRHGLVAQQVEMTGEGTGLYRTDSGVDVQGETLTFRHLLLPTGQAVPRRTFDDIVDGLFRRWSAPQLDGPGDAQPVSWQRAAAQLTADAAARWADCRIAGKDLGLITSERREHGWRTWFTWRYQPLRTAMALHRMAELTGDEHLQEQAEQTVRSLLLAPSRAGLPPALIDIDPVARQVQGGTDDGADGHAGWIRTLDAVWTAYWRLRARQWLPNLSEQILAASRETTRFLLANQLANGAFPTFFDAEYLAPRRRVLFDDSAESAGAALFLAEYGAATGDGEALAAAGKTLQFLDNLSQDSAWRDFEIWRHENSMPANATAAGGADGSIGWLFASFAAVRLAQVGGPDQRAAAAGSARRFLHRLATFQQVRVRAWHPEDLVGGISCTNLDSRWNDARTGLAAEAFLAGYELTGERIWLQRGALALRAVLHAPLTDDSALAAGAGAGAISSQLAAAQWGQGVVDVDGGFAQGLDAIWLSELRATEDEVWLQCSSDAGVASARLTFRGLGSRQGMVLNVNGKVLGFRSAAQLTAGVDVEVRPLPRLDFRPPAEIAADVPWPLQVPCSGQGGAHCTAVLELRRDDQVVEKVPLALNTEVGTLQPVTAFVPRLPVGTQLAARLLVADGGTQWSVPAVGSRRIVVSDYQCLDPGDDDESYLQDAGDSRVALFADGREGCRELLAADAPQHPSMIMAVPVPPRAVRVQLDVWLLGAAQIDAEDRLLHLDSNAPPTPRHLQFTIADRRLWPDGLLPLRFEALGASLQVARIRYRSEGDAAEPPPAGHTRHNRVPASSLRIAVLPLRLDDLPCEATPDQLRTACFGDADYAMTPAPNPTVTAGSAASVLNSLSGGGTKLQGQVLHRLDILLLAAELRSEPDGGRQRLIDAVREALEVSGAAPDLDAVVVVHGGGDRLHLGPPTDDGIAPRILFMPERGTDGTFLASGDLLYRLLRATRELTDASAPEHGAFGALALGGVSPDHQPAGPIALDREKLGWVDRIELDQDAELEVPTLQQDRAFLGLRCIDLQDRGDLIVEGRREIRSDAGGDGVLLYWDQSAAPVLVARPEDAALVTRLRLSPRLEQAPTPFFPGTRQDLFAAPFVFGLRTHPTLATPRGEVPWALDLRHERGRSFASVTANFVALGDWRQALWQSSQPGAATTPMPLDLDLGRNGQVTASRSEVVVRPPLTGSIEGQLTLPRQDGLQRLFVRLEAAAGAPGAATAVRLGSGDRLLASVRVAAGAPASIELDLPPQARELRLACAAAAGDGVPVRLRQCTMVPRQPAWTVLTPPQQGCVEQAWMDQGFHSLGLAMRTDNGGRASLELPLILPSDPSRLRLVGGLPLAAARDVTLRLRLSLRAVDGSSVLAMAPELRLVRGAGATPLWTALVAMPEGPARELRMLRLELSGPPDTDLWFQTIEVCPR